MKLERRQLSAEFHSAHGNAIMYRNNFAAHSGAKVLELAEVAVVLPPKSKAGIGPNLYREMTQPDYYSTTAEDKSFADLIEHSRELAVRKIVQLTEKVLKEDVLPKGYDYWARK